MVTLIQIKIYLENFSITKDDIMVSSLVVLINTLTVSENATSAAAEQQQQWERNNNNVNQRQGRQS